LCLLSLHAQIVFKVLACYAPLKILPETRFKDLKTAILTLKMLTEAGCDSVTSYRKPPVTS